MQSLNPLFGDDLAAIRLEGTMTPIGRDEAVFADYPEALRLQLAERHARVVREKGALYVVDLGDEGRTTVNGKQIVQDMVEVSVGDTVVFGESLAFQVASDGNVADETQVVPSSEGKINLLLVPQSDKGPKTPIAVTEYPFLVSKTEGHFANYQGENGEWLAFLSRRHATLFQSGSEVFVEDLGSTNGTLVNDRRVSNSAISLQSGDTVCFGHAAFTFQVVLVPEEELTSPNQKAVPEGTVLISSPGSFLDIYCDTSSEEASQASVDELGATASDTDPSSISESAQQRLLSQPHIKRLADWWQALPVGKDLRMVLTYAAPVAVVLLLLVWLLSDGRPEQAQSLFAEGKPAEAMQIAAEYLVDNPEDAQMIELLGRAYEQALVPQWSAHMSDKRFAEAHASIDSMVAVAPLVADDRLTSLLMWMAQLGAFEASGAISLADQNADVRTLLGEWDDRGDGYTRLLRSLSERYAEFRPVHAQSMSNLRAVKGDSAALLEAVAKLKTTLRRHLDRNRHDQARTALSKFGEDYPRVADFQLFAEDLEDYAALAQARAQHDLMNYVRIGENLQFKTRFFQDRQHLLDGDLEQVMNLHQQLEDASVLWREGQLQEAIDALAVTGETPWDQQLNEQRARYERYKKQFEELLTLVQTPQYPGAVINFYTLLDADLDRFMFDALRDDFVSHRDHALEQAQAMLDHAGDNWTKYRATYGGISGGLRLEPTVSDAYRQQAQLLSLTYFAVSQSKQLFRILEVATPTELEERFEQVTSEVRRQRGAIAALGSILNGEVVDEKLRLLPKLEEVNREG